MGLVTSLFVERRSLENPRISLSDPEAWEIFGGTKTSSGQRVNETTALGLVAVFACVRVLAETVGSMPLVVYKRLKGGGKERATDHPNHQVLHDRANSEQTSMQWRETGMGHLGLRGNAFSEKVYDGRGRLAELIPIRPDRVQVERVGGAKQFQIDVGGRRRTFTPRDIMHVPGLGYDGLVGYSPVTVAREALGLALAAQEHGATYFDNGAEPGGVLQHPQQLSKPAQDRLRASFESRHKGSANAHRVFIAEEGMTWQSVGMSNRDSQFLETRKFQLGEIARLYRVPPHLIGDLERATFSNIEQQSIDFVVHTIRPWLVRWEQVLNWELFTARERQEFFCEFNVEGLLRGDSAARGEFYTKLFGVGALSVNDIREKENLNPVPGGDKRFVPLNMVDLEKAGEAQAPTPAPAPDSGARATQLVAAQEPLVVDALGRLLRKESQAARRALEKAQAARSLIPFTEWIEAFYPEHGATAVRTLDPIVRAAAAAAHAFLGTPLASDLDLHAIAQRMADAHVMRSRSALTLVITGTGPAERSRAIATTLEAWDGARAGADGRLLAQSIIDAITTGA
jgi:HK97 family phage portal protein